MITDPQSMDESLFFNTFYYAPIGICLINPMGNWFKINPSFCNMVGFSEDELMKISCLDITHPEDRDIVNQYTARLLNREFNTFQIEKRYIHKNGQIVWALVNVSLVRDAKGMPQYLVIQVQDITERKHVEQRMEENQQRYHSLWANAPLGICAVDLNANLTELNPEFAKFMGYSTDELLAINILELVSSTTSIEQVRRKLTNCFSEPMFLEEVKFRRKDGSEFHANAITSPIFVNHELQGVYFMIRDLTEHLETQGLLQKSEKLSMIGELAAGIAHEIRNPLTSLRGFVQLFQREDTSLSRKRYHDVMISEIDRINQIVSELLVLAKPELAAMANKDIIAKLDSVITLLESQANLYNVQIRKEFAPNVPLINCEENKLKQVFINVLKNAIESMPLGGEVLIQAKPEDDMVCVRIIDQGCGIPQDQLALIGNPFYTTKETGTGLGLMVSQRIIQNHKGIMRIESEVGKGTTIEILLPIMCEPS